MAHFIIAIYLHNFCPYVVINSLQAIGAGQIFAEWLNKMNVASRELYCFLKLAE